MGQNLNYGVLYQHYPHSYPQFFVFSPLFFCFLPLTSCVRIVVYAVTDPADTVQHNFVKLNVLYKKACELHKLFELLITHLLHLLLVGMLQQAQHQTSLNIRLLLLQFSHQTRPPLEPFHRNSNRDLMLRRRPKILCG